MALPHQGPITIAVTITGTCESVALKGPNAGSVPSGVKQKIISIASKTEN